MHGILGQCHRKSSAVFKIGPIWHYRTITPKLHSVQMRYCSYKYEDDQLMIRKLAQGCSMCSSFFKVLSLNYSVEGSGEVYDKSVFGWDS